jgi:SAM-dependent methyltransferase
MSFGESARLFNEVRRNHYAAGLLDEIARIFGPPAGQRLIDLGCGTGIGTRHLSDRGFDVVGVDPDRDMIDEARSLGGAAGYDVMSAGRLYFCDGTFHGATAFSAFQFFCDDKSVREIGRVLRPGGCFVVVNRSNRGPLQQLIAEVVRHHTGLAVTDPREGYQPASILRNGGFVRIEERRRESIERLSAEAAISYARTTHFWQQVPRISHDAIDQEVRARIMSQVDPTGHLARAVDTTIVFGHRQ